MIKLGYDFYNRCPIEVARDLLGKKFIFNHYEGIIVIFPPKARQQPASNFDNTQTQNL